MVHRMCSLTIECVLYTIEYKRMVHTHVCVCTSMCALKYALKMHLNMHFKKKYALKCVRVCMHVGIFRYTCAL